MTGALKTPDELRAEIAQLDAELQHIADKDRATENGLGELSLAARRSDAKAQKKLDLYDQLCAARAANRRGLQAARGALQAELSAALALERSEETKAKAREAKEILEILRKRGASIDQAFRTAIDEYFALLADAGGGLIIFPDGLLINARELIVELAARYRLPAVYPFRVFPEVGGLSSYGPNFKAIFRQTA